MVQKQRHVYGVRSPHAKLTENDVKRIRALARQGWTTAQIARQFNVSVGQVGRIVAGKAWTHVQD